MYTEEELELLRSEPELIDLKLRIREERARDDDAEAAEWQRQYELDATLDAPLHRLRNKGKLWSEWSAQWWRYTSHERALSASITELAKRLLWEEDAELTAREALEQQWIEEWQSIQKSERVRYRIITEWFQVWDEQRCAKWDHERHSHKAAVDDMLWRMFEGAAADEEEIKRWEREVESLEGRIRTKCEQFASQAPLP